MRSKFSELYWGIAFIVIFALLSYSRNIYLTIKDSFGEFDPTSEIISPFAISWRSWLLVLFVLLLGLLWTAIWLWRHQTKIKRLKPKK